jgi:preprotein translocase subunit YajC
MKVIDTLKIGSKVKTIGVHEGLIGIVTNIQKGSSSEDHGIIEIKIVKILKHEKFPWSSIDEFEHFTFYQWHTHLKVLD